MEAFTPPSAAGAAETLCLVLLHSLWQGGLWCLALGALLSLIPRSRPQARYLAALGCLVGPLVSASITWSILTLPIEAGPASTGPTSIAAGEQGPAGAAPLATAVVTQPDNAAGRSGRVDQPSSARLNASAWWAWGRGRVAAASPVLLTLWGVGVALCLMRCVLHRTAAARWRAGTPVTDPPVLERLHALRARLGIRRPVRLVASLQAAGPCVAGTLRPVILIPASLAAGLTPDQWTAILAHELAHVRRWDDLVNFAQQVLESLLFFNPAVWWLSRQVRVEREACCDAWGAALTAGPVGYAHVLVDVAERLTAARPLTAGASVLPAFADERSGSLLDRVRRLVAPQQGRDTRVTLTASVLLIAVVLGSLFLLQRGSDMVVLAAAQILNDEERVSELSRAAEKIAPDARGGAEPLVLRGTLVTEDGSDLPERIQVTASTRNGNSTSSSTKEDVRGRQTNRFETPVPAGVSWLFFNSDGYAMAVAGPFSEKADLAADGVQVTLKRGVPVAAKVVDESDRPVPNARLNWLTLVGGSGAGNLVVATTNAEGEATLPHIDPTLSYSLWVTAPGFQKAETKEAKLSPTDVLRVQINHARPVTGVVKDPDGRPLAGATFRQLQRRTRGLTDSTGSYGDPVATTDADGRFALSELLDGWTYDFAVRHPQFGPALVRTVQPGDKDLAVQLPPAVAVTGVVRGTAEDWAAVEKGYNGWRFEFDRRPDGPHSELSLRDQLRLKPENGEARFEIPGLADGLLVLTFGDDRTEQLVSADHRELTIDLGKIRQARMEQRRPVRLVFTHDGKPVTPEGTIAFSTHSLDRRRQFDFEQRTLSAGRVELSLPAPCRLLLSSDRLIGYAVAESHFEAEVAAGTEPATVEIPVRPAGAVKGLVLSADGSPAANVSVYLSTVLKTKTAKSSQEVTQGHSVTTNAAGEFFVTPVPFGAACDLRAARDKNLLLGPRFTVTAEQPFPDHRLQFAPSVAAAVLVVDEEGRPLGGVPIQMSCRHPRVLTTWMSHDATDTNGRFVFDAINPELAGEMLVLADSTKDFVPADGRLRADGGVTEIRLKRGLVLEGTLLDRGGQPMVGQFVKALPAKDAYRDGRFREFLPEAPTDARGRFRLSNLPDEPVNLRPERFTWSAREESYRPAKADSVRPVVLKSH